ncbi:unnamed protein product, partial [Chrysoparadoxa australica]
MPRAWRDPAPSISLYFCKQAGRNVAKLDAGEGTMVSSIQTFYSLNHHRQVILSPVVCGNPNCSQSTYACCPRQE